MGKKSIIGRCGAFLIENDWCIESEEKKMKEIKGYFKIGDIIKGIKHNGYGVTNQDMTRGEVIELYENGDMEVKIIEHPDKHEIGETYRVDNSLKKFERVKPFTKSDLQDGDIVTLRNGDRLIVSNNEFFDLSMECCNSLCYMRDLKEDLTCVGLCTSSDEDIIKVERPLQFITMYERQEVKEMTVEEVSKALGYDVKIVK